MKIGENKIYLRTVFFFATLLLVTCSACGLENSIQDTTVSDVEETALSTSVPTSTSGPGEVLILGAEILPSDLRQTVQNLLGNLAEERGFIVRDVSNDLDESVKPETRFVFALDDLNEVATVADSNPGAVFVSIGLPGEDAPSNTYYLAPDSTRYDELGFLAGYIAAVITPDYRIGGIALEGDGKEIAALKGFVNGGIFYCGLCRPSYPPFSSYPQSVITSSAEPSDVNAAVKFLRDLGVTTIYLSPGLNSEQVFDSLKGSEIWFIGSRTPSESSGLKWVASISSDISKGVEIAWETWVAGQGGKSIIPPLMLSSHDEDLVPLGKLDHFQKVIEDLAKGRIDTAVDSQTGEPR
jgi:basic membrane lipoprotein Med (substrate-binding protein (PBP1-ABC) superfamily)